tara:strand:+ start:1302 stop:1919 length:618 start_codon:yes stop_codon:yes gene_type:complete
MKKLFTFFFLTLLLSCNNDKTINGYYLDNYRDRIFHFDNNESHIIDISDSIEEPFNFKIISKAKLSLNGINYLHKSYKDSLVLFDYEPKRLTLKKINIEEISIDELKSTSWSYDMDKEYPNHNLELLQQTTISFDNELNMYPIQNKDTLTDFILSYSKLFDKFNSFKPINYNGNTNFILVGLNSKELRLLYFTGRNILYTLKKVD